MAQLVKAGVTLRDQVNARWPKRDKRSDGWIGDAAHSGRASDHNPTKPGGWVFAIDLDENFGLGKFRNGGAAKRLSNELLAYARSTLPGHDRIKYVVYEDRIASATYKSTWWKWRGRGYGHLQHIHISFNEPAVKNGALFPLPCLATSAKAKKDWTARLRPWL